MCKIYFQGKGLFATRDINVGEVIVEEEPIISCQFSWNALYGYQSCSHCMTPLETAEENARRLTKKHELVLPYPQCCITKKSTIVECICGDRYCSEACRVKAFDQYHRNMCLQTKERNLTHPLERLEEFWRNIHYPPETMNIMLLVRMITYVQQSENREEAMNRFMSFCHKFVNEDNELAHKLVGEQYIERIDGLLSILKECVSFEGVENWLTNEGFRSLLALVGTNGQGIASSAISTWVDRSTKLPVTDQEKLELDRFIEQLYLDLDTESGAFLDNEGSGLYVLQSSCNHSCDPNAKIFFKRNNYELSIVALKSIGCGEQIFISYLEDCALMRSRYSRQKILMENYLFKCSCLKCFSEADQPEMTSEEDMSEDDDEE